MPKYQSYSTNLNQRRQSTGLRPLIVLCVVSILVLTFYLREGDSGPIHTLRAGVTTITTPARMAGNLVSAPFNAVGNIFGNLTASRATLDELEAENAELTARVAELAEYQATSERLEKLLDLQSTYNLQSTAARIIGQSSDAWSDTVTIDKGSLDGISVNMPVTNSTGVIGQVIEVAPNASTVRLLTDEGSGVSAMIQDTRAQGMVQGQPDGTLRMDYVSVDADVKEGDIIITSGIGGVYPKGLPIGTVASVTKNSNDVYYTIIVSSASRTESNEEVLVITSLTEEQTATDEDVASANNMPAGGERSQGDASGEGSAESTDTTEGSE